MGTTITILVDFVKEFIPANKDKVLIVGIGTMLMSLCLMLVAVSSGLSGDLTYLTLHPGVTAPAFLGGLGLTGAALVMKPFKN